MRKPALIIDTHADTTGRLLDRGFDFAARHEDGHIDLARARDGGLGAVFMAIWVPGTLTGPRAVKRALVQIDAVRETVARHPAALALARTAADVRRARAAGRIAVLMGVEGGHMIDDDLGVLRLFSALGVQYLTLTHNEPTAWADSSGRAPRHNGLTEFGRQVVGEMNRLGMMVDVSHASDRTFWDVLEESQAPVIASHSSARAICDHPRNLTDEMMRALADKGGVVQVNFHNEFIDQGLRDAVRARAPRLLALLREAEARCGEDQARVNREMERAVRGMMAAGELPRVGWERILDHIDHAVRVAGEDHVGIGSDFDGAFMPEGMDDVSRLPRLAEGLAKRGHGSRAVGRILGGNTLRLLAAVHEAGRALRGGAEAAAATREEGHRAR